MPRSYAFFSDVVENARVVDIGVTNVTLEFNGERRMLSFED